MVTRLCHHRKICKQLIISNQQVFTSVHGVNMNTIGVSLGTIYPNSRGFSAAQPV